MSTNESKRLVVVGDRGCGKTNLVIQFILQQYIKRHKPSWKGNSKVNINMEVKNKEVELVIQDTYDSCTDNLDPRNFLGAHAILMCFPIDEPDTLANIYKNWSPEIRRLCPNVPIVLVGNKIDIRHNETRKRELLTKKIEPLQPKDGRAMAKRIGACAYRESSVWSKIGVKEVFEAAVQAAMHT